MEIVLLEKSSIRTSLSDFWLTESNGRGFSKNLKGMMTMTKVVRLTEDLPKGIHCIRNLPDPELAAQWDSIILGDDLKERLLSQALLNFTLREKISRSVLPLHGVILLVGAPGTGKTTLARGLANRVASVFSSARFSLLEVDPHALNSSAMGKTQRAVSDLFSQAIAEAAQAGPTLVLLDEVEALAADRSKLSLEANPIDIHRATDAVLVQLDQLAERFPRLLFIATSNFPEAVDQAFTSRCDLVTHVPLPDREACRKILQDTLSGLAKIYPLIASLQQSQVFDECAGECVGLDGRAIRKAVANALAANPKIALNPETVTIVELLAAIKASKLTKGAGGSI